MELQKLLEQSQPFLKYVVDWEASRPKLPLNELVGNEPERVAVVSVDMINGFCYEGPLSSPRVAALVGPITDLFTRSYTAGVRHFIVPQDTHTPDAVEFESYPPHCIRGTSESEAVPEFKALPFWDEFIVMPKQSINAAFGTDLNNWLDDHPEVDTFITVGDCTDLCTYQLAMHLKLRAVAANQQRRVVLPINCVDTYDLPVDTAAELGSVPHNGDLLHLIFLYSMMLNGVEVVAEIS